MLNLAFSHKSMLAVELAVNIYQDDKLKKRVKKNLEETKLPTEGDSERNKRDT